MGYSFYHIFTTLYLFLLTLFFWRRGVGIHNVITKIYHMSVITLISRKICDKQWYALKCWRYMLPSRSRIFHSYGVLKGCSMHMLGVYGLECDTRPRCSDLIQTKKYWGPIMKLLYDNDNRYLIISIHVTLLPIQCKNIKI
jgi:hypothetical protein